ncbi:DUF2634 domain-containing protein [Clostridium tertium]|uniref:DUF2634 domain-containing protein n=1 Tax=Clostridium tertium TaxID=1559 RepID=A0A9X3XSD5_9CLOT|nr:DUF2634 domain-containing protein [Clostridium tertium]MBS6502151.1 DUF2634 domain-containing protein [Clostridium sp.]MDB1956520.1 DUF2634 domain-containing protein [Clostridium tertium]MDB1958821.1 DUF2634 domain-containing protein [Clostridium tertium]MDB1962312.1 DUF2634 domain-containing protein [Clostridium tertium]MDB1967556.1 DUF2634 domain-containing protein [Clostridium tertium]
MIPKSNLNDSLELVDEVETSRTYKILIGDSKGYIEGLGALKQAIYKVLSTERYEYPIYSFNYGIDIESLIGKDYDYVRIELKRRIEECLLEDERINSVNNFSFEREEDVLKCTFEVESIYGNIILNKEVEF